jgi:hypothetical protein
MGRRGSQEIPGPHEIAIHKKRGPQEASWSPPRAKQKQQVKEVRGRAGPNSRGRSGDLGQGSAHARMVSSTSSTAERWPPESHHARHAGSSCKAAARARASNEAHRAVQVRCASCRRRSRQQADPPRRPRRGRRCATGGITGAGDESLLGKRLQERPASSAPSSSVGTAKQPGTKIQPSSTKGMEGKGKKKGAGGLGP